MHRQFFKIVMIFKLIAMIEEILFNLHVANGIHIIIQVYLHEFKYKYQYNYFYICTNNFNFSKILPLTSIFQDIFSDI